MAFVVSFEHFMTFRRTVPGAGGAGSGPSRPPPGRVARPKQKRPPPDPGRCQSGRVSTYISRTGLC